MMKQSKNAEQPLNEFTKLSKMDKDEEYVPPSNVWTTKYGVYQIIWLANNMSDMQGNMMHLQYCKRWIEPDDQEVCASRWVSIDDVC